MLRFSSILIVLRRSSGSTMPVSGARAGADCWLQGLEDAEHEQYTAGGRSLRASNGNADQPVQIDCDDMQFFADHMELFQNEGRVIASGNVVYISGGNTIAAERMEFNTRTRTGTFYNATGTAVLREAAAAEHVRERRSPTRISGAKSCRRSGRRVPHHPRRLHDLRAADAALGLQSGSVTLNLDDYALLKNAVFRVKGVPLMYLPDLLLPDPGGRPGDRLPDADLRHRRPQRGQSLSNAFFWAINRSQDATIEHDWFSKTGQQVGGEYRYVRRPAHRETRGCRS